MKITRTSFRMIREDHALLWLPLISGLCLLAVLGLVFGPLLAVLLWSPGSWSFLFGSTAGEVLVAAVLVALYFVLVFVGTFFTAGLVGAAMMKLDGGAPTVGDGIRFARQKLRRILVWSLIAASVGLLIQIISSRIQGLGGIVLRIAAGATWGIATYFIVPVLVFEDLPTWGSLKRSAGLFLQTFGRTFVSNIVLALIAVGIGIAGFVALVLGIVLAAQGSLVVGLVLVSLGIAIFVTDAVLTTAVSGVMRAALYRYATTGRIDPGLLPPQFAGRAAPPPPPAGTTPLPSY
ncbi:MAG TPA: DUF6159 family protein [Thermoplasmata archaeon]|nr:DUF6159 family protein [Thermoplasmata archaeon]